MNPFKKYGRTLGQGADGYVFRVNPSTVGVLTKKLPGMNTNHKVEWYKALDMYVGEEQPDDPAYLFTHIPKMDARGVQPDWLKSLLEDTKNFHSMTMSLARWDYYFGEKIIGARTYRPHVWTIYENGRAFLENWDKVDRITRLGWDLHDGNWRRWKGDWWLVDPFTHDLSVMYVGKDDFKPL